MEPHVRVARIYAIPMRPAGIVRTWRSTPLSRSADQPGGASFLCVIKDCGDQGRGTLSFPMRGISIALDIPIRDDTQALVDVLNEHVLGEGGRIYLAKDSFTRANHFQAMEGRLGKWLQVRDKWDPQRRMRSRQSVRILGDPSGETSRREGA